MHVQLNHNRMDMGYVEDFINVTEAIQTTSFLKLHMWKI